MPEESKPVDLISAEERLAKIEEKRAAKAKAAQVTETMADAEFLERLDALEEEHGTHGEAFCSYRTPKGALFAKRGANLLYHRFVNSKVKQTDVEAFVKPCLLFPDKQAALALLEEFPAAWTGLANELVSLYGLRRKEDSGK